MKIIPICCIYYVSEEVINHSKTKIIMNQCQNKGQSNFTDKKYTSKESLPHWVTVIQSITWPWISLIRHSHTSKDGSKIQTQNNSQLFYKQQILTLLISQILHFKLFTNPNIIVIKTSFLHIQNHSQASQNKNKLFAKM